MGWTGAVQHASTAVAQSHREGHGNLRYVVRSSSNPAFSSVL